MLACRRCSWCTACTMPSSSGTTASSITPSCCRTSSSGMPEALRRSWTCTVNKPDLGLGQAPERVAIDAGAFEDCLPRQAGGLHRLERLQLPDPGLCDAALSGEPQRRAKLTHHLGLHAGALGRLLKSQRAT